MFLTEDPRNIKVYIHPTGSPFPVRMVDEINPNKVHCYGAGLDPKGVKAGQPAPFVVDASEAGEAPLEVTTTDQTGAKRPAQITPRGEGVYDCTYYPEVEGNIKVDVNYASQSVPGRWVCNVSGCSGDRGLRRRPQGILSGVSGGNLIIQTINPLVACKR